MNKSTKIDLLYKKAHGYNLTIEEAKELRKYKVDADDANIATRANVTAYVNAVDRGYSLSFYDYCANNLKGDRRRRGGKAEEIADFNKSQSLATLFMGWLVWGIALYWMADGNNSVGTSAIMGAVVAFILQKCTRKYAMFTLFLLPIILAVVFNKMF